MHLLLTRPEDPNGDPLGAALAARGHTITSAPVLRIALTGGLPDLAGAQALIVTSQNALRAISLKPVPDAVKDLVLYAVGPATADLARALGFRHVVEGPGSGRELAPLIAAAAVPGRGALAYLTGAQRAFDFAAALGAQGFDVRAHVVYRAEPMDALPAEVTSGLAEGAFGGVLLMSPRTARTYVSLVAAAGLAAAAARPAYFCLSEAVARDLHPLGAVNAVVARAPNSQEMLALIAREAPDFP